MGRRSGSGCPLKKPGYLSTRCVQGGCHLMHFFALRLLLHSCRRRPFGCRCCLRCRLIRSHGGCSLKPGYLSMRCVQVGLHLPK